MFGVSILSHTHDKIKSGFQLYEILPLLGWFGFLHSVHDFAALYILVKNDKILLLSIIEKLFLFLSYVALLLFGYRLINISKKRVPFIAVQILVAISIAFPLIWPAPNLENWELGARYFLGFPAAILCAIGFKMYYEFEYEKFKTFNKFKWAFFALGLFTASYAFNGGLLAPEAPLSTASIIDYNIFYELTGIPNAFFRTLSAIGITVAIWPVISFFKYEHGVHIDQLNKNLKMANTELIISRKKLLDAQDDERKRISRDLHNQIGQSFSSMLIFMKMNYSKVKDDQAKDLLASSIDDLEDIMKEVHRIIWSLRPMIIDDIGFDAALKALSRRYAESLNISVKYNSALKNNLPKDHQEVLYRIALECLNNSMKHAKASQVSINLSQIDSNIVFEICDNGTGFKTRYVKGFHGLGLVGMEESAKTIGGSLKIKTSKEGTTITTMLPLDRVKEFA